MSKVSPGVLSRIDVDQVTKYYDALQPKKAVDRRREEIRKAQRRTSLKAMTKFCDQADGEYQIRPDHPVIVRFRIERNPEMLNELRSAVGLYQETPAADRREVLRRYYLGDFARKVVGIGSVGTEAFVLLLMGERAAGGQGMSQAATDELLGSGSAFDRTIAQFSVGYAEQNEKDYPGLVDAVATSRVQAVIGLVTANPRPRLTGPLLLTARARPGTPIYHQAPEPGPGREPGAIVP